MIDGIEDPVADGAVVALRVARAQAFGEGNERTAFLLARWRLDRNDQDAAVLLRPDDRAAADLLVRAAAGSDTRDQLIRSDLSDHSMISGRSGPGRAWFGYSPGDFVRGPRDGGVLAGGLLPAPPDSDSLPNEALGSSRRAADLLVEPSSFGGDERAEAVPWSDVRGEDGVVLVRLFGRYVAADRMAPRSSPGRGPM